jgi:hypothetical protein
MPNFSCADDAKVCTNADNMGWRYVWYTCGSLVFVMSILRITVIRLKETPKYQLGQGKDVEVVETMQWMATKYNRPCSLTVEALESCGPILSSKKKGFSWSSATVHFRGLFLTKKLGYSTCLIWLSWTLIGLAYPLYNVFLPEYLATRGADVGDGSPSVTWRNYAIVNLCGIFGPILAGFMCEYKYLGRRGTMVVGAILAMIFFFAFTAVRTSSEILGFNCAINFCLNIYYGCLYAYTPEVLPSAHRATGNGISVACNRVMGIMSALVATYANTATSIPIYICAALYIAMAGVAALFPFEPFGRRSF